MGIRFNGVSLPVLAGALAAGLWAWPEVSVAQAAGAHAPAADAQVSYNIAAQPLPSALIEYARQSGVRVLFSHAALEGRMAPAVRGAMNRDQALQRLLRGSGYAASIGPDGSVRIRRIAEGGMGGDEQPPEDEQAQAADPSAGPSASQVRDDATAAETIVVTGTRLPGQRSPSPVTVITREAIEESGAANVTQLMRTLPQNFGGGPNEATRAGEGANNLLEGSSINLRGLGADSTLVLINGRRISTTGTSNGLFVDISSIPVAAIERVEVLTDGASAIYGSDAIGGVVNFILRNDFDGAETGARYGEAYDGAAAETGFSMAFGHAGDRARLLAVYDYFSRDPLANAHRDFAASSDLTPFGGSNFSLAASNPATVVSPVLAAVPPGQDGTGLTASDFLIGQRNLQNTNEGQHILGEQERQSLYLSGALELSSSAELFGELRGSVRDFRRNRAGATSSSLRVPASHPGFVELTPGSTMMILQYSFIEDLGPVVASGSNESLGLVGGVRFDMGESWQVEFAGLIGREDGLFRTDNAVNTPRLNEALGLTNAVPGFDPAVDGWFNPFADGSNTPANVLDFIRGWAETRYASTMDAVTITADGELFALPAGAVRLALGAEYREESFDTRSIEFTSALTPVLRDAPAEARDVLAYFAEARIPLVAPEQNLFGVRELDLTLAARHEDTSNGGADTTPQVGLLWSPFEGLLFRSSWGRSFKSPSLNETVAGSQAALVFSIADPAAPTGFTTTLILQGTNPGLESETAESWTGGFSLRPPQVEGFTLDLNVFRIDFENRIARPANPFTVLTNPGLYAPIITRDPDDAVVQAHLDAPYFIQIGPTPPASSIGAIVDARLRNLSRSLVSGLDLNISQRFDLWGGELGVSLAGSYLFDYEQAFSETAPLQDLVGTANNPVDLRLRGAVTWRGGGWRTALFVNHVGDYLDTASDPDRRVDAWTTFDLSLGYQFEEAGALDGVEARFFVRNLLNEDPPFLNNPIGVGYDPENADPVGRFLAFELRKTW